MKIGIMDKFYFPETERTYTKEGYLVVPATIARPGIQLYKAIELVDEANALPKGMKAEDPIVVYRPPEEVFNIEAVNSFKNIAVTNNHPPEFLNSKNHRQYSVGVLLADVHIEEDKYVKGTIKITDEETINDVKDGKVDVSAGYYSNISFLEGITPEGQKYQAVQRDIEGNHIAIVARGRAGSEVKIADGLIDPSEKTEKLTSEGITSSSVSEATETMFTKEGQGPGDEEDEFGLDGVPGDSSSNPFGDEKITDEVDPEEEKEEPSEIKDIEKELTMKLEDAMSKIAELEGINLDLSSKILDQAGIDKLVYDRITLLDACTSLVDGLETEGKSNLMLKKEVLSNKLPNINMEVVSDEYINAAFDVLSATITDTVEGKHDKDVYGEDLSFKDEVAEGVEKPETPEGSEYSKNTKELENPDENEKEPESEESKEDKLETSDSASVLDQAFANELKPLKKTRELSAYEKYCLRSRESWKK